MVTVKRISKADVKAWEASRNAAPAPFQQVPQDSKLQPFLSSLDPARVYITHLDRHPTALKSRIYTVPVVLNITIFVLLIWRVFHIVPWYVDLLSHVTGQSRRTASHDFTLDTTASSWSSLLWVVLSRSATFMLDFVLARFILPWPISFFFEQPANPALWRWSVGFRPTEIIVRYSRGWGAKELVGGMKKGSESPFWKTRVLTGTDRALLGEKTGYLLMGKDWDLDFAAMIYATGSLDKGKTQEEDWEKSVLVFKDGVGWCIWKAWEGERNAGEEEQRKKMILLKDKLVAMKKESLFWRWIEIVQYESSKPGVFDRTRQEATAEIIKKEFEKQGVDFEALIRDVGGIEGTPGM